ncbi:MULTISPECIES: MarR family winged helix-turn-helix transcriptional regulator [unclassified Methylophilus]|uniref:MarR family winged helix-turn-helix transcriptional regulator n=1 Tax=unclassified Methylophilus TaxID=2630143 RepID=UPI00036CAC16|nr:MULTISPECIES: MarR family winged helix-turn-helix transcriptional regulator [unclassified Methylophilus]
MQDPIPSSLEEHIGFWLRFVSNQVSCRFEQQLALHDISVTEWVAMRTLFNSNAATHSSLIDALGMTKGAASKIISKLEVKGLAKREQAQDSLREQVLCLTERGKELVPTLATTADENDKYFFGHLSVSSREDLKKLMKELVTLHQLKEIPTK